MLDEKQIKKLGILVQESYGSPESLAKQLDLGIEMLFYVEESAFTRAEIQNLASTLRSICWVLRG